MFKYSLPAIALILGLAQAAKAQHLPGVAMGNYAGTNALYHNPAFVADSRYSFYVNVVGTQFYTANNHVRYEAPYSFLSLVTNTVSDEYRNERGVLQFPRSYLGEKLNGNQKYLNAGGDARLPSVMFNLFKGKIGVGISTRVRYMLNTSGVTEPLARLISKTTQLEELQGPFFDNQAGRLHLNGMGEVAFTLGGTVYDNETDFLKVGFTVKRLIGLYNAHAIIDNSSYDIQPDETWENKRQFIRVEEINMRYGITRDEGFQNIKPSPAWLIGGAPPGSGWGFDLGAVYEYRPDINKFSYTEKGERKRDASKNKYLYRVAVSLTDIGRVHFKNPAYVLQQEIHTTNKELRYDSFQKLEGSEGIFNAINSSLDGGAPLAPNFKSVLPTAFQASVDYHVQQRVYVSGLWVQNLIPQSAFGMKAESAISVTPRYEHKWYEISVPLTLMNRYRSPAIGLAGRIGPLWLGTDHLTGLLNIGNPKSFNLYFGISAGLFRRPPESQNQCWPPEDSWIRRIFSKR
ncbi:DUF5723 family protein [Dyadobacter chenhuakuii]|uniref:DUF5723 family protein n=1 Tax=Dyadobacter chenhuakuii TaxID=2909339 RepID=A0A9X1TT29_9BACT|nr:DUF5723 family protein [Dyadobacter chenhuakuii]MCF2491973.1 DUF5723 family protein [Dyadobacter chenhuakuii]MCF2498670.1 DUF5723 family protein [Dyadobacter chenhuakuii]USJ28866.1 DUF5723 family protein [Dyadobacter chenhuakuii]